VPSSEPNTISACLVRWLMYANRSVVDVLILHAYVARVRWLMRQCCTRRGAPLPSHLAPILCRMRRRQRRRESTACNSKSPKVHRRESCLATAQIKPVSLPGPLEARAEFFAFRISATAFPLPPLSPHLALGVRRCSAIALRLGGCLCSLDDHLQVLSLTTRLNSRHQRVHVLQG